jgi:thioredoxin-related protein
MRYWIFFITLFVSLASSGQDTLTLIPDTIAIKKDSVKFSSQDLESFRSKARFENKPYFIFFSAPWCAPCHRIKNEIFTNTQIASLANDNYLAFYMDLESFDGAEMNSRYYKVSQLPTVLFFDPQGKQTDMAIGYFDGYYFFRKLRAHVPPAKWGKDWEQP